MAYCHIKDVGMKFDEHVYYMAALFSCNIAASLALIPLVIFTTTGSGRAARRTWACAGALAVSTIVGFIWSRTIGFPQMEDHVGEWDTLGITSLGCEGLVVAASASMLPRLWRDRRAYGEPAPHRRPSTQWDRRPGDRGSTSPGRRM
jgi:hypothetical protein